MPRSIARFSTSAPSHHSLSSAAFTIIIAESNFRYTQGYLDKLSPEMGYASKILVDWRHFSVRAIHHVEVPWAVDRDKKQVSVRSDPGLVNHFARHVIVATRT
jgi:hypothetical protein